jgi:cell division protein FtsI (penicillin-binding protein 3)/stage V sporulation protein D (sporulation-specific penicillin-binding protein)
MIEVLDKSLNTGAIFAMRSIGAPAFKSYVDRFGFGKLTGIELAGEEDGTISSLDKSGEIYSATASFGHGITATPIQLVTAYAAIARGGIIVKPHIIASVITEAGEQEVPIQEGERVITPETAQTITAMLVSVVKNGFSKKAGVNGYSIAGKSGTAQIPNTNSPGYSDETIHSFIGFGPIDEQGPVFVMLVKLDKPKGLPYASDTVAPLFSDIAKFILSYFEVPPEKSQ